MDAIYQAPPIPSGANLGVLLSRELRRIADVSRANAVSYPEAINVTQFGITSKTKDITAALQALLDENPRGNIVFPPGDYYAASPVYLSDATGRKFSGTITGFGATIHWTTPGSSADTEINMQKGLTARPNTLTIGSDTSGSGFVKISGLKLVGPTHGASVYLANCLNVELEFLQFGPCRYNVVTECCINTSFRKCQFSGYVNAAVGMVMLGDTSKVYYGQGITYPFSANGTPASSYWNDSPKFDSCSFTGTTNGGLGHILDHGSQAENIRKIVGCLFYSAQSGYNVYGIVSRLGMWDLDTCWFEDVNYAVRILAPDSVENPGGVTTLTGVSAAEPSGTYGIALFPNGYSGGFTARTVYTSKCINDYNLNGVTAGNVLLGPNTSQWTTGVYLTSIYGSNSTIVDVGCNFIPNGGTYKTISNAHYMALSDLWPLTLPQSMGSYASDALARAGGVLQYKPYLNPAGGLQYQMTVP